jgi:hypothetical protein
MSWIIHITHHKSALTRVLCSEKSEQLMKFIDNVGFTDTREDVKDYISRVVQEYHTQIQSGRISDR